MQLLVGCLAASCLVLVANAQRSFRFPITDQGFSRRQFNVHPAPIRGPVAASSGAFINTGGFSSGGFSSGGFRGGSGNPCSHDTCGPNTRCEPANGIARCRCLPGFVPDGNTIEGCKYQCVSDNDCDDRQFRCSQNKCVRICEPGTCGLNAECRVENRRPKCECPDGYSGNPDRGCRVFLPPKRAAPPAAPIDPCLSQPCGTNAVCKARDATPVCSCPVTHEGNPLTHCSRRECIRSDDCPQHQACQGSKCINPCNLPEMCGLSAECVVRNHQPVCSCGRGMTGDPFVSCRLFRSDEYCNPSPCGRNTNCKVRNDRAECSCITNYIGDPLVACHAECTVHSDCSGNRQCRQNRCVNPCAYNACGEGAHCAVTNNNVQCTCPQFFQGNPHDRCFAECTAHDDCRSNQACFQLKCIDPCVGACGTGANCKVENHKPICSCPKDMTGHPFESCRPFTDADLCANDPCGVGAECNPGTDRSTGEKRAVCTCPYGHIGNPLQSCRKGDCERPSQCGPRETCHNFVCQDACNTVTGSVCGENAECIVRDHKPVCRCPVGYIGTPTKECYVPTASDLRAGRF